MRPPAAKESNYKPRSIAKRVALAVASAALLLLLVTRLPNKTRGREGPLQRADPAGDSAWEGEPQPGLCVESVLLEESVL